MIKIIQFNIENTIFSLLLQTNNMIIYDIYYKTRSPKSICLYVQGIFKNNWVDFSPVCTVKQRFSPPPTPAQYDV